MKKCRTRAMIFAVALGFAVLIGCGQTEEAAVVESHLIVANFAETQTMDPRAVEDTASHWINNQIFDGLVRRTDDMGVEPALATDWRFVDDRTIEFSLRQGVLFHNGEAFTARDVKFTYETLLDREAGFAGRSRLAMIDVENIEIIDDYTIRIPTNEPFAAVLTYLAHSSSLIVSKSAVEQFGADFGANPVGTGPFKLSRWDRGTAVHLERFDEHWRGPAQVERLTFRGVPEGSSRTIEVETGGVHVAQTIPETDFNRLRDNNSVELHEYEAMRLHYIMFNTQSPPFDDVRVRQAISYALDIEELAEVAYGDAGSPARGYMNSSIWAFNPDVYLYPRNMDRARELLAEAGYADGFRMTMTINDDAPRQTIAEIMGSQLRELGIEIDIEIMEWGAYLQMTAGGEHHMAQLAWLASTGDPHHALHPNYFSGNIGAANRSHTVLPELDELLLAGVREPDAARREQIYREAQELISSFAPIIPVADDREAVAVRSNVTGFVPSPSGYHMFHEVGLD
ncbi:MAG: glutathione ABC transporter substrate-binding protein [Spirochaetaceae bacterium]|nr:MAG: glutathione ABC transporter substrate-binding protein [Spirochaetaceae bacterium]